jgi:hypothetical protein
VIVLQVPLPHKALDSLNVVTANRWMQLGPFIQTTADNFGCDPSHVRQLCRALREAGLLTTGARGVNAPHMTALDAARLTVAVLAGSIPTTVIEDVRFWGELQTASIRVGAVTRPGPYRALGPGEEETLEKACASIFDLYGDDTVIAAHSWKMGDVDMVPTVSLKLSERDRTVTITEEGAEITFMNVRAGMELQRAQEAEATATELLLKATQSESPDHVAVALIDAQQASDLVSMAAERFFDAKKGVRVTRALTQEELCPVARALREV